MRETNGKTDPSGALLLLLAVGAGLAVATIYYNQPMLGLIGRDLGIPERAVGLVPTLTQLGYALGILFLTPLGDLFDRRRVILAKGTLLAASLVVAAAAGTLWSLLVGSLLLGLCATLAQDIVPAAAAMATAGRRGQVVGKVMTGILLGILLSRVVSGLAAQHAGWRAVYGAAAAGIVLFLLAAWRWIPSLPAEASMGYVALLRSLQGLWQRHPQARRATWAQGFLSMGFSAFWSTLALMLASDFHLGSAVAGAFGLVGAAGALGASFAGRLADRLGARRVVRAGAALVLLSFVALAATSHLGRPAMLVFLGVGALGFDLGYQFCLISHQTIVYGLEPPARSRLNALLFVGMFLGMSAGSALGNLALARFGWIAVPVMGSLCAGLALGIRLLPGDAP